MGYTFCERFEKLGQLRLMTGRSIFLGLLLIVTDERVKLFATEPFRSRRVRPIIQLGERHILLDRKHLGVTLCGSR